MYLNSFTQTSLTDAAQTGQLKAVSCHKQVLRHGTIQIATFQFLFGRAQVVTVLKRVGHQQGYDL